MENFQKYKVLLTENNNFRKLFAARLITLGGDWLLTVPLLGIIYELTENPFITSLVLVVQSAPLFMLGSFGGYLADRFDRKKIIAVSEFLSGLTVLLILYAVTTENVVLSCSHLDYSLLLGHRTCQPLMQPYQMLSKRKI